MLSTHFTASSLPGFLLLSRMVLANPDALWIEPSLKWYGIDGNWSAFSLFVGEPAQQVDVTVSTSLSEIWVIEDSGCGPSALCTAARGNVFNISASNSWSPLGAWQLGLEYLGLGGNGEYAMETIVVYDSVKRWQTTFQKQVVAGINDTDYYTGFFGLGITPGRFGSVVVPAPISSLVEQDGVIPSHSYGYTAGAYYGGQWGTPLSLTLGGYDENRFVPHSTTFSLNSSTRLPEVLVRGITASVTSLDKAPTNWSSTSLQLLPFNESLTALVDSSTPYLWLPTAICDRFADALKLTWNESFGLYLFSDNAVFENFSQPDVSFVFTLSSTDNRDNFGQPLNVPGVINITISANAFRQTLRYPFMNLFNYGDAAIPYFPLKRATNGSSVIIGRTFLQEAYIITNYETSTYSIHQALFPDNPKRNTSIVTINPANNSPYPGAAETNEGRAGVTKRQIGGIVAGAFLIGIVIILMVWWMCRRKKHKIRAQDVDEELKERGSSMEPYPPRSPVARFLARLTKRVPRRSGDKRNAHEVDGSNRQPVEVGTDGSHARYELPVPSEPVELDATDATSINGTTELGTEETHSASTYELARRKMTRQLQGPVPEYTPPTHPLDEPGKSHNDMSPVAYYRSSDHVAIQNPSPVSTPTYDNFTHSLPSPMSPYTPHGDWLNGIPDIPSPMTFMPPNYPFPRSNSASHSPISPVSPYNLGHRSLSLSASSSASPTYPTAPLTLPSPAMQRTPIDSSNFVCLGPLPNYVRLPRQSSIPRLMTPDTNTLALPTIPSAAESRRESAGADTLGSNYTVEEEAARQGTFGGTFGDNAAAGRIDGGDLVHIPQPAEKRFSWEDE
ncbi:aspartic peptidase domain-containing protein [Pseudomassariella vexata]|uniref:Aspartic peptidase domain-containing protein n=1 Tax=Pseudomassariella vexata TaxID=1141098 RepID=A0A1Y2E0K8_9PEZI|nr:aspartic peptidase domain-containing protein [Pseudomassariella vexata]ORY65072.1 aspartic peptidase domain-containing protein [Pseudomassariella vexata]